MFFTKKKPPRPYLSAVVAAAGTASRMEGVDKQQIAIQEIPVVVRSVEQFCRCREVDEIVLVCREEAIPDYYALVKEYDLYKVVSVVGGGAQRQDSVWNGVCACHPEADYLAVHDGARPLVTEEIIRDCIQAAMEYGGAAAGVPAKDTYKLCDEGGFVRETPDRSRLYAVQTPQIFRADWYRAAIKQAVACGRTYTDDCQLFEQAGHKVFISWGSYENIKVTTPEDLAQAQAILAYREGGMDLWI